MLFQATRPVILNGIPDLAERADLADRAITLNLPTIPETERAFESDFWERFDAARPRILAGLLDATAQAMANKDSVRLSERPRLADFARWVTAAESALGWPQGAFLAAYQANRRESEKTVIDNNTVAAVVLAFTQAVGEWRGTASELAVTLRKRFPAETENRDPASRAQAFLARARHSSRYMRTARPGLIILPPPTDRTNDQPALVQMAVPDDLLFRSGPPQWEIRIFPRA